MNKTVRLIITILLLIVCLLFLSCNETGKKGRVLFTYVPDGLSLTAKQLKTEVECKEDPRWNNLYEFPAVFWKYHAAASVKIYLLDSYEQLGRVADQIKTALDYFSWDEIRDRSEYLKGDLLRAFPPQYFENNIVVALCGISYVPKTYIGDMVIKEGRLQIPIYSRFLQTWVITTTDDIKEGEQLILISMRRPEQEINSALMLVEMMPEEWDMTGPKATVISWRLAAQEELFPNLRKNGK